MKKTLLFYILMTLKAGFLFGQIDTTNREMVSMSATYQKPYEVGGVYYKKKDTVPFTGVLFGKYANGNYLSVQEYVNGIGNGTWVNYYENGNVKEIGTYRDNRVEGPIRQFHENGKLKAEGTYAHWRRKVGVWKYYDPQGEFRKEVTYPLED